MRETVASARWPRFRSVSASTRAGAAALALVVLLATLGPLVAKHGPFESDFVHGMSVEDQPVGPCALFPLGADRLYRDVLARLGYGARLSLLIGSGATLIACAVGSAAGVLLGWLEGTRARVPWPLLGGSLAALAAIGFGRPWLAAVAGFAGVAVSFLRQEGPRLDVEGWLVRAIDAALAMPFLLLFMAVGAAVGRVTALTIVLALGLTGWMGIARLLRVKTMHVRSLEYVDAARAIGASTPRLLARHVFPNVAGPLIVAATVLFAQMIVADSVLGYLGLGISPPTPTLGRMLVEAQDQYASAPWAVLAPALAILLSTWGFNMIGEGLRRALDPGGG